MDRTLEKLLLSELRIAIYEKNTDESCELTDEKMILAVTANEELGRLGYTLKPQDLTALAMSPSLEGFPQHFRGLMQDVKAEPMYPDFPKQVMAMDEAEFRFHQLMHYFSTYGIEALFGVSVSHGWMPDVDRTEKTEEDATLLEAKVLELVPEDEAPLIAAARVLGRRNRLNSADREIVVRSTALLTPEEIAGIRVPFKENLIELFEAVMVTTSGDSRLMIWRQICSHTGDVIKCINGILPRHDYHFRTSQKKSIVRLLESYTAQDFKSNLILSRSKRERSLKALQFLDYNMYSRSAAHREAVRALRNGELRSWEARARYLLASGDEGALDFISARPGMMLRMINWLLNLGYTQDEILDRLSGKAGRLSLNTMVNVINAMDLKEKLAPDEEKYLSDCDMVRTRAENEREHCYYSHSVSYIKDVMSKETRRYRNWYQQQMDSISKNNSTGWLERHMRKNALKATQGKFLKDQQKKLKRLTDPVLIDHLISDINKRERNKLRELEERYHSDVCRYERDAANISTIREIMKTLIAKHLEEADTDIRGKKVYLDTGIFDLERSRMTAGAKTDDGGYLPDGIKIKIPEQVDYLRMFVYWNDEKRVDVDLHAFGVDMDGKNLHIGWDDSYYECGIVHSGDITESDAAEYIDIDMSSNVRYVDADIDLYDGRPCFGAIGTCYVGMMAVKSINEDVRLYDPANCFFTHELRSEASFLNYAKIDVQNRTIYHAGKAPEKWTSYAAADNFDAGDRPSLTVADYLDILIRAQGALPVSDPEDAEVILTVDKSSDEKAVSLSDRNFFLEA